MSAEGGEPPPPQPPPPQQQQPHPLLGDFKTENFCDEVYDYMDDSLAEAMVKMEQELIQAAAKVKGADQGGGGGGGGGGGDMEATIKTCCDNVQTRIQQEFDRNIDILDRYIKKNVAAVAASVPFGPGATEAPAVAAAEEDGRTGNDAAPAAGGWGAGTAATGAISPAAAVAAATPGEGGAQERSGGPGGGGGVGGGSSAASSAQGGAVLGVDTPWATEVEEGAPPKRLEEEEVLDAEIQQLRKRRREGLRRCAALVRKGARETVLLQDVKDFVDALQMGVSSSFDDNGLTPIPSKVQEAVQSCAELRVTADRAQALTRRLERQAEESAGWGGGGEVGGGAGSSAVASTVPPPRDLQSMFQRSSEQQVVAGSAAEYSTLDTRLRG
ncbi:unnamed protein product [Ectocarpus fasciculatus]